VIGPGAAAARRRRFVPQRRSSHLARTVTRAAAPAVEPRPNHRLL